MKIRLGFINKKNNLDNIYMKRYMIKTYINNGSAYESTAMSLEKQ